MIFKKKKSEVVNFEVGKIYYSANDPLVKIKILARTLNIIKFVELKEGVKPKIKKAFPKTLSQYGVEYFVYKGKSFTAKSKL